MPGTGHHLDLKEIRKMSTLKRSWDEKIRRITRSESVSGKEGEDITGWVCKDHIPVLDGQGEQ